jgi:CDP-diacylglycerol--glycerol-3-phosphate 3-phosphatidyltransferase
VRITANQVTLARLALIPIPGWLLYQGVNGQYAALVLATILGCTDFIDGYLARKYGSTVLGGLMDPIADKVFTAVCFMPAVDLGWLPAWLVAALFAREFAVTAARSVCERRGVSLKSPYLARYKTWVQMCGIGVLFLLGTAPEWVMDYVFMAMAVLPVVFFALRYLLVKKMWKGAAYFAVSLTGFWIFHRLFGSHVTAVGLGWFILAITWASGFGYIVQVTKLLGRGSSSSDWVRLLASIALPAIAVGLQATGKAPSWALISLVSLEMAHGGLDNLLAHHHAEASVASWGLRLLSECALLVAAIVWPQSATMVTLAALTVGTVGLITAFVQKRRYYLDERTANKPLQGASNPAVS